MRQSNSQITTIKLLGACAIVLGAATLLESPAGAFPTVPPIPVAFDIVGYPCEVQLGMHGFAVIRLYSKAYCGGTLVGWFGMQEESVASNETPGPSIAPEVMK